MSTWAPKRFWKEASVARADDGSFRVELDGRAVRTPAKTLLTLPSRALAEAVAAEWQAQEGLIDPQSMPFTRMANSALDKVTPQFSAVAEMLADYGAQDLLCYRATGPSELCAKQAALWDPLLASVEAKIGGALVVTAGVMPVAQPSAQLERFLARVMALSPFALTAFHDLVAISGSLIIGFAVLEGEISAEEGFDLSRLDEDWQIEQWGDDEEAAENRAAKRLDFLNAARFAQLCGEQNLALSA